MIVTTNHLERELSQEKAALAENLEELAAKARDVADWRVHVARHPWESVGIAVLAGGVLAMLGQRSARGPRPPQSARRAHPAVARVVGTLTAVAATKAMQMVRDVAPAFADEFEKQAPKR